MTVLIAGCGFVGARLADLLHAAGHRVLGLTHSPDSAAVLAAEKPWPVQACDISSAEALAALDFQADVVVHCASSNRGGADMYRLVYQQGMSGLMARFPSARFVFTSSTSVYPQVDGSIVTEDSDAQPDRETGRILRDVENAVIASGGIVARLAGIYGPGRSFVLKNLLDRSAFIEGNEGQGRALNQIHRDDAASALAHLIASNQRGTFNVVDDSPQTQRDAFITLGPLFNVPLPPAVPPATDRKRGWTHKFVSNAKLRATGWKPQYPTYRDALMGDRELVPSILAQVQAETGSIPRSPNIVIVGLMGCGKSTVARLVSSMIGFQSIDTDQLIVEAARANIPKIFETEGEAGFRIRESAALRSLLGKRGHVIATGGGIVTQPVNLPLLRQLGYVIWLDADVNTLVRRTASSRDRPLLLDEDPKVKLERLLEVRKPLYESVMDQRIRTDTLSPPETSYGVAESARVWFAKMREEAIS
jgi:shikimate kinase/nucleoside-diphosphate-sugar epimerase